MTAPVNSPITNLPFLYLNGFQGLVASNTTITVQPGQCRDQSNTIDIVLGSVTTLNTAIVGLNGLDTGTIANSTMYAQWAISSSANIAPTGVILSLATNSVPTLPFGYDSYRIVDFWLTDSSGHLLAMYTAGSGGSRYKQYDAPISVLSAGTATSYTAIDLSVAVPPTKFGLVNILTQYTPHAAADTLKIQPTGATGDLYTIEGIVASVIQTNLVEIVPLIASSKPEISYKLSSATSPAGVGMVVLGYNLSL